MSKATWEHIKDCIIVVGMFIPLFSFVEHLLETYNGGISVFSLTSMELLMLVSLIIGPLIVLRLLDIGGCQVTASSDSAKAEPKIITSKRNESISERQ